MAKMTLLGHVIEWAGLTDKPPEAYLGEKEAKESPREAFLKAMDMTMDTHWRDLAIIDEDEFKEVIRNMEVNGAKASIGVRTKMALIGHVARVLAGKIDGTAKKARKEKLEEDVKKRALDKDKHVTKVALSEVSNQLSKEEVPEIASEVSGLSNTSCQWEKE